MLKPKTKKDKGKKKISTPKGLPTKDSSLGKPSWMTQTTTNWNQN
jgi:hypothetical protein